MNLSPKQKQTRGHRLVVAGGGGAPGGVEEESGVSRCKILHIEWVNNKVLLRNTGNYTHYSVINHNGKEYKNVYIYT